MKTRSDIDDSEFTWGGALLFSKLLLSIKESREGLHSKISTAIHRPI